MDIKGVNCNPLVAVWAGLSIKTWEWGTVGVISALIFPMALLAVILFEFLLRPGGCGGVGRVPSFKLVSEGAATSRVDAVAAVGLIGGEVDFGH